MYRSFGFFPNFLAGVSAFSRIGSQGGALGLHRKAAFLGATHSRPVKRRRQEIQE